MSQTIKWESYDLVFCCFCIVNPLSLKYCWQFVHVFGMVIYCMNDIDVACFMLKVQKWYKTIHSTLTFAQHVNQHTNKEQIKLTKNINVTENATNIVNINTLFNSTMNHIIIMQDFEINVEARQLAISMVGSALFNNWKKMSQSWSSQVWMVFLFLLCKLNKYINDR